MVLSLRDSKTGLAASDQLQAMNGFSEQIISDRQLHLRR